jgi:membrane AbrB-like protein
MPFITRLTLKPFLVTLSIGLISALLFEQLRAPLPWMLGPLVTTAVTRMSGLRLHAPVQVREAGQWAIGTALGLYFTLPVLKVLQSYAAFIALGVLFAMFLGALCGWLLHKMSGVDRTTAFFAMAVGGASEMASQGESHGAKVDRVAAAHSLRIMMVVAIIPLCFQLADVHGGDIFVPGARAVSYGGLIVLGSITSVAALLLKWLRVPNAWVIGPLVVTIALTATGTYLSALPEWTVHLGQLFIGISLGTRFTPEFLHTAPRYLASVALCALMAMVIAACFAMGLSAVSGIHPATAILATSPGGIAEMSLTAKTLQLGVPIVTAFHVTRMAALVLTIGPLFRFMRGWRQRT